MSVRRRDLHKPQRLARLAWLGALSFVIACVSTTRQGPSDALWLDESTYVQPLVPGVWRHVSFRFLPGVGRFPSNGLIARAQSGALIIDTAWSPEQTVSVLDWTERNVGRVRGLIITHAHDDRTSGLAEAHRRAIPSYALPQTVRLVSKDGGAAVQQRVASGYSLAGFGVQGEIFFPGAGHAPDNATVWLAAPRILFGGCLVRSADAKSLGNTADADVATWPKAIAALQARYPDVKIVVPGHGDPSGPELLTHTRELLGE